MDIKEIGTCAVVVIGGIAYGVSSGGLKDALSDDVRHVTEVSNDERPDYMNDVVLQFSETFTNYIVQSESYDYVGISKFSATPSRAMFVEVVTPEERVPEEEIAGIKAQTEFEFCEQDEMKMFTDKGWSYSFSLTDGTSRRIFKTICSPDYSKLDPHGGKVS